MAERIPPIEDNKVALCRVDNLYIYAYRSDIQLVIDPGSRSSFIGLAQMVEAAARRGFQVIYIDVGCSYGTRLCQLSRYIKNIARSYRVFALDAGPAARLVPYTLLRNRLTEFVEFREAIAWDKIEILGAESNRSIAKCTEFKSTTIVPAMTLAAILDVAQCVENNPIFVRLDTPGTEIDVIRGARHFLPRIAFVTAAMPIDRERIHDLTKFIYAIRKTHHVFETIQDQHIFKLVTNEHELLDRAFVAPGFHATLIAVPKMFPFLLNQFRIQT